MSLEEIRREIDAIDNQLVALLTQRMQCSEKVAQIKRQEGLPIFHAGREQEILKSVTARGGEYGSYLAEIYSLLMACSRELQNERLSQESSLKKLIGGAEQALHLTGPVVCYGAEGSFSHLALTTAFGTKDITFAEDFADVFEAVDTGRSSFGFVPVENSSAGSVGEVYDLILKYKLFIVGSVRMPVRQNLLMVPGGTLENIKMVYSHPQALSQCRPFLEAHGIAPVEFADTATAAEAVARLSDKQIGAVGSAYCAEKYGLEIAAREIQSFEGNKTRFIVLSSKPAIDPQSEKISIVFSLSHTPGSLQRILTRFSLHGLNLTKLESRVGKNGDFETQFYLDFLGNVANPDTLALLCALQNELVEFTFLGNYKEFLLS